MKQVPIPYSIRWWGNFNTDLYAKVLRAKANKVNNDINTRLTNLVKSKTNGLI